MGARIYSKDVDKRIVQEYLNGQSTTYLRKKYGFKTNKSVIDKIKKYGGKVRTQREELMLNKPYENFTMSIIDSEFKAYYLGLLLSDGYISKNEVGLSLTDEDCIKFISSYLNKNYNSYERNENRKIIHRIILNNPRLIDELRRYGVVPNKTHTLNGFKLFDEEEKFYPYIIRGLIDGDGWIRKDGKEFFICTASYDFALWIQSTLENKLYMNDINILKADGAWQVRTAIKKNIDVLKLLVYDKQYGMNRKYKLLHSEPSETIMDDLGNQD